MPTPEEQELLERYSPLIEAELRRIGVSEADERWIHAGAGQSEVPLQDALAAELAELRRLPTGLGVVKYCARLGIDYASARRMFGLDSDAV